jgi:hypothetical protein
MLKAALILGFLVAAEPVVAQSQLPPELHQVGSGAVTAHFGGEKPDGDMLLRYGVTHLWFTFAGDAKTYAFHPKGELHFSDWQLDVFSPQGRYVLLLQDRHGPYHIVATARLKTYLTGGSPDFVVSGVRPGSPGAATAGVHHDARWTSAQSIEFSFSCCGTEDIVTFDVRRNKVECVRWRKGPNGAWKSC